MNKCILIIALPILTTLLGCDPLYGVKRSATTPKPIRANCIEMALNRIVEIDNFEPIPIHPETIRSKDTDPEEFRPVLQYSFKGGEVIGVVTVETNERQSSKLEMYFLRMGSRPSASTVSKTRKVFDEFEEQISKACPGEIDQLNFVENCIGIECK